MKKDLVNQSGRSMIEAIGYISVMIMLTTALTASVNSGMHRFKLGRINQELVDLKKVISQRFVSAENYKEVSFDILIDEKIVPYDVRDKKHSFNGGVKIGKGDANGNTFYIEFDDVPLQSCTELGTRLWVVNDGSDLDAMDINGKTWAWEYSNSVSSSNYKLPAKPTDVAKACKQGNENKLKWYFN
ncbi:MAG: hypothetical protein E7016_05905 [Alphaproteobacteria bacterium]|nr:hypothetical protein [Alphaproteobacteria bacterium]